MAAKIRTVAEKSPIEIQDPGFIEKTRMSISNRTQGNPGEVKKRKNKHTKKLEMTVPRLTVPCNDISELTAAPLPPTPFARRSQTHDSVFVGAGGTAFFGTNMATDTRGQPLRLRLRCVTQRKRKRKGWPLILL